MLPVCESHQSAKLECLWRTWMNSSQRSLQFQRAGDSACVLGKNENCWLMLNECFLDFGQLSEVTQCHFDFLILSVDCKGFQSAFFALAIQADFICCVTWEHGSKAFQVGACYARCNLESFSLIKPNFSCKWLRHDCSQPKKFHVVSCKKAIILQMLYMVEFCSSVLIWKIPRA